MSESVLSTRAAGIRRTSGAERRNPDSSLRFRPRHPYHDVVFYMPNVGQLLFETDSRSYGGAEKQVVMLARSLVRRGYRVALITQAGPGKLPPAVDGVTIVPRQPRRRWPRFTGKIFETLIIWKSLRQVPSRTIVTRCGGVQVGLLAIYARLARRRLIFASSSVSDFDCQKILPKRRDRPIYRLGVRLADMVVVQTEEQLDLCQATFGRAGVLIKSIAEPVNGHDSEPVAFLWAGRLASYKRPLEYVELARAVPEARFWLIGVTEPLHPDGPSLADAVYKAAADVPNLELLEPRSPTELGQLMSSAVASVSTGDFEGMPNVLLEAWSRGIPALALTHDPGGVIATHGVGAFANGSREAFAALAREQWHSRQDRAELSRRCREYVTTHHAPDVVADRWGEVLELTTPATEERALR